MSPVPTTDRSAAPGCPTDVVCGLQKKDARWQPTRAAACASSGRKDPLAPDLGALPERRGRDHGRDGRMDSPPLSALHYCTPSGAPTPSATRLACLRHRSAAPAHPPVRRRQRPRRGHGPPAVPPQPTHARRRAARAHARARLSSTAARPTQRRLTARRGCSRPPVRACSVRRRAAAFFGNHAVQYDVQVACGDGAGHGLGGTGAR